MTTLDLQNVHKCRTRIPNGKLILYELAIRAKGGIATMSLDELAEASGINAQQTIDAIMNLERAGLLALIAGKDATDAPHFVIVVDLERDAIIARLRYGLHLDEQQADLVADAIMAERGAHHGDH